MRIVSKNNYLCKFGFLLSIGIKFFLINLSVYFCKVGFGNLLFLLGRGI